MFALIIILIGVLVMFLTGYPLARLFFPRKADLQAAASPLLGLVVIVLICQTAYDLGFTIRALVNPVLVAAVLVNAVVLYRDRRTMRPVSSTGLPVAAILAAGLAAVLVVAWPGFSSGPYLFVAHANFDTFGYWINADWLSDHLRSAKPSLDGYFPGQFYIEEYRHEGHRQGGDVWLSFFSSLLAVSARRAYYPAISALMFLGPLSAYIFARTLLGFRKRQLWCLLALSSVSSLACLVYSQNLLPHVAGAALLAAIVGPLSRAGISTRWRPLAFSATLMAGALSIYPEILLALPFFAGPVFLAYLVKSRFKNVSRALLYLAAWTAAAIALNPYRGLRSIYYLFDTRMTIRTGGATYAYAFGWQGLPISFGITPMFWVWTLPPWAVAVVFSLGLYLLVVLVRKLWIGKADGVVSLRWLLAGVAVLLTTLVLQNYSYGFFKAVLLSNFAVLAVFAVIASEAKQQRLMFAAVPVALLFTGNLYTSWYLGDDSTLTRSISADNSFNELETLKYVVPKGDGVLIDVNNGTAQFWAESALSNVPTSLARRMGFWATWEGVPDLSHHYSDRWALRENVSAIDLDPEIQPVFRNARFQLVPVRNYVTASRQWLENEPPAGQTGIYFRNNAELLLIAPTDSRYVLSFHWKSDEPQHARIFVEDNPLVDLNVGRSADVSSPEFAPVGRVTHLRISVDGKAATDERITAMLSGISILSSRQVMKRSRPEEITAGNFAQFARVTENLTPDDWCPRSASFKLGNVDHKTHLSVAGQVPAGVGYRFPYDLKVTANGVQIGKVTVRNPGDFEGRIELPPAVRQADFLDVNVASPVWFVPKDLGINPDPREFAYRFKYVSLNR